MVVMSGVAADVRALARAGELSDRSRRSQQLDRPVDRGESERRLTAPRPVVHLDDGERAGLAFDGVEHRSALWSQTDVCRKLKLGHGWSIVRTILIRK